MVWLSASLSTCLLTALIASDPVPGPKDDWKQSEAAVLTNIRQVTRDFARAGEGYFSPDGRKIVFQAEESATGNPFYQIYTMSLEEGSRPIRLSPGVGKTTCAYFSPTSDRLIYASTHLDPDAKSKYAIELSQRQEDTKAGRRRRYQWDFDSHMDIFSAKPDGTDVQRLTDTPGYDAEGSISADGKQIVFCSNRTGEKNFELFIMDSDGKKARQLTKAPGSYNGGPFFSPDGKRVVFRSDRSKKDQLQLYVIDSDGSNERSLTNDLTWVQWGPYWHPDNQHIIYAGADHGDPTVRPNYDLYWMNVASGTKRRITFAPGADVCPVFSPMAKS